MNATDFEALLIRLNACTEAKRFCHGKTLEEAWTQCVRPEWMLWLYRHCNPDAYLCADLARLFAVEALEAVGATEWADIIRDLPTVVDADTAVQAEFFLRMADADADAVDAYAYAVADAARAADAAADAANAYAAYAANAAAAAAAADAAYAAAAAANADAAAYAARAADAAADADADAAYAAAAAAAANADADADAKKKLCTLIRARIPVSALTLPG